jgi:hypothetical protein
MTIIPAALRGMSTESTPLTLAAAGCVRRTPDPLDIAAVLAAGQHPRPDELVAAGVASVDLVPTLLTELEAAHAALGTVAVGPGVWVATLSNGVRIRISDVWAARRG